MVIGGLQIKERGFTLIELMVVTSIIGILAAVLFASFDDARKLSRDKVRMSELKELQLAVELYKAQNGMYPTGCSGTTDQWTGEGAQSGFGIACATYIDSLTPDYLPELPSDPNMETDDGKGFVYRTNAARTAYKIMVRNSVENQKITSYSDEFARCPTSGTNCATVAAIEDSYAVYSFGAETW
jgi:prepilin-type N-terminal cleavage/methylation domain-containing protein